MPTTVLSWIKTARTAIVTARPAPMRKWNRRLPGELDVREQGLAAEGLEQLAEDRAERHTSAERSREEGDEVRHLRKG